MKNSKHLPFRRARSRYSERLDAFSKHISNPSTELAHDLLAPLAENGATQSALDSYMSKLDETFDVSEIDRVHPFLPLVSDEKLEDIGLKMISLSAQDVQKLLSGDFSALQPQSQSYQSNNALQLQQALYDAIGDEHSEEDLIAIAEEIERMTQQGGGQGLSFVMDVPEDLPDNQIRIDRSDVVNRVLKARAKDTSVTVVPGPKTAQ